MRLRLLTEALQERLAQVRLRLLLLLAFIYDNRTVLQASDNLRFGSAEKRAYALEVIDILLPSELKRGVMPLARSPAAAAATAALERDQPPAQPGSPGPVAGDAG